MEREEKLKYIKEISKNNEQEIIEEIDWKKNSIKNNVRNINQTIDKIKELMKNDINISNILEFRNKIKELETDLYHLDNNTIKLKCLLIKRGSENE